MDHFSFLFYAAAAESIWDRLWQLEPEWLVLWLAVLAAMVAVAWYIVSKIRPGSEKKEPTASQWLSKYRDLHSQGGLSDEEFRTIKTTLATQLQEELRDSDQKE